MMRIQARGIGAMILGAALALQADGTKMVSGLVACGSGRW